MINASSAVLVLSFVLGSAAAEPLESQSDPAVMVSQMTDTSDSPAAQSAYLSLCRMMRKGPPATVHAVHDALCRQLAGTADAVTMRRICLALRNTPCDAAVIIVVDRLQPETPARMRTAACQSLFDLVSRRRPADPKITELALSRLGAIARDRESPLSLLQQAMLTMSAFGPAGFDALMALHGDLKAPKHVKDVFYTALSDTGDPRALPILRTAVTDPQTPEGLRIQAANAVGRLFYLANRSGQVIDATERARCWEALYQHLINDAPDQLFGVALKSLVEIGQIQQDATILQTLNTALSSSNDVRREAALDVLYRIGAPVEGIAPDLVRSCAESSTSESVRSTAIAVLEQSRPGEDEGDTAQSP